MDKIKNEWVVDSWPEEMALRHMRENMGKPFAAGHPNFMYEFNAASGESVVYSLGGVDNGAEREAPVNAPEPKAEEPPISVKFHMEYDCAL